MAIVSTSAASASAADDIPPAPRLLPEDTLAFVRISDVDEMREGFTESSVGRMLSDPKMRPFAAETYRTATELFELLSEAVGLSLDELLEIPHGQVAAAVIPVGMPEEEQAEPSAAGDGDESEDAIRRRLQRRQQMQWAWGGVVMVDAKDDVDRLMGLVRKLEQRATRQKAVARTTEVEGVTLTTITPSRQGRQPIEFFQRDGMVVLALGHSAGRDVLDRWNNESESPTLAESSDFGAVMSRSLGAEASDPTFMFYADPYKIVERIIKGNGGAAALIWPMVEDLGLGKLRGLGGCVFRGGEVFEDISHFHVLVDPPRDGFFGVLRPESGTTSPPDFVAADVISYTSLHWDFPTTLKNFGKILDRFQGPDSLQRFVFEPTSKRVGVDIEQDVLPLLTGRYTTLRWMQPPVRLNSACQMHALEVQDAAAAAELVKKVAGKFESAVTSEVIAGVRVYTSDRQGRRRGMPSGFRRPEPCFLVLDRWIVFTDSKQMLERAIRASKGSVRRLSESPEYDLISSELGVKLGGEDPFAIGYVEPSQYIRQLYDMVKSEDTRRLLDNGGDNPVVKKLIELLENNELPAFSAFEKYFAPGGFFGYDEPGGMHLGSFTLRATE